MYKDFTNPAESLRQERYRVASTPPAKTGRSVKTWIGHALMRMGRRLTETPVVKTEIEVASV